MKSPATQARVGPTTPCCFYWAPIYHPLPFQTTNPSFRMYPHPSHNPRKIPLPQKTPSPNEVSMQPARPAADPLRTANRPLYKTPLDRLDRERGEPARRANSIALALGLWLFREKQVLRDSGGGDNEPSFFERAAWIFCARASARIHSGYIYVRSRFAAFFICRAAAASLWRYWCWCVGSSVRVECFCVLYTFWSWIRCRFFQCLWNI